MQDLLNSALSFGDEVKDYDSRKMLTEAIYTNKPGARAYFRSWAEVEMESLISEDSTLATHEIVWLTILGLVCEVEGVSKDALRSYALTYVFGIGLSYYGICLSDMAKPYLKTKF